MAANQCKDCARCEECKTKKGSHHYCFQPARKSEILPLEVPENSFMPKEKVVFDICHRCGRKLKTPESVERGYGSICYKKVSGNNRKPTIPLF